MGNPSEILSFNLQDEIEIGYKPKGTHYFYNPLPIDDPKQRQPTFHWQTAFRLVAKSDREDGLKETYTYFKKIVSN